MTLDDVAQACEPPTTPQTIGRLETGTRTVSVGWLNRIARALGVEAADLVRLPDQAEIPGAATLDPEGVHAPRQESVAVPPRPSPDLIAMAVASGTGDYRRGDEVWLQRLAPSQFASALNRDVLVPRPGGRFIFGRLIGREDNRLQILPFGAGQRQTVVTDPAWAAMAVKLIRNL